jgi:hypothetical protein
MLFYVSFFFFALIPIFVSRAIGYKNNIVVIAFSLLIPLMFSALRGDVGTDTIAYKNYYEQMGLGFVVASFEPTFFIFSTIGNFFNFSAQYLIIAVSILQYIAIIYIIYNLKEKDLFYILIITSFFVYQNMNLIRAGSSLYILGLAYVLMLNKKTKHSLVAFSISCLTHITSFVFAPAFFRKLYFLAPASIIAAYVGYEFSSQKIIGYSQNYGALVQFSGGIGFFVVTSVLAYVLFHQFRNDREIFIIIFLATILEFISFFVPILDRFSTMFYFIGYVRICYLGVSAKNRILLYTLCVYGLYGSLVFILTSDDAMYYLVAEQPGFAELYKDTRWVPYRFFWQ